MRSVLATITVASLAVTPLPGETAPQEQTGWNWNGAPADAVEQSAKQEAPPYPTKSWFPTVKPGTAANESGDIQILHGILLHLGLP